jgi:hypothetical protein
MSQTKKPSRKTDPAAKKVSDPKPATPSKTVALAGAKTPNGGDVAGVFDPRGVKGGHG